MVAQPKQLDNLGRPLPEGQRDLSETWHELEANRMTATAVENIKAQVDRNALINAVSRVSRVIKTRSPKAILMSVIIEVSEGEMTLMGSDLETWVRVPVERVDIQSAGGRIAVNADRFGQALARIEDPTVTIDADTSNMQLSGSRAKFKINTGNANDFPAIPDRADGNQATCDGPAFASLLSRMGICASTKNESTRYAITGVLIECDAKKLRIVSSDGNRVGLDEIKSTGGEMSGIIPNGAAKIIANIVSDEGEATVHVGGGRIFVDHPAGQVAAMLMEGNFVPYRDVTPKSGDKKASIPADELDARCKAAQVMTNDESSGVRMSFDGEALNISSRAPELGEADVSCPLESWSGEPIDIGFNPAYLSDACRMAKTDTLTMTMTAPNKPALMEAGTFKYVIMPINLK